jgi:predicted GIY-YIG superfamily endonuclease
VLNGTTVAGLAAAIDERLVQAGYTEAQEPADYTDQARSASIVFYAGSENREEAIAVGELLDISDRQPIIEDAQALAPEAEVVVVVGADQSP